MASSGEDYLQALIEKERTFAGFLPTLQFQPEYSWASSRGRGFGTAGRTPQLQFQAPVAANYSVFNGFGDVANFRRAGYTAQEREALVLDLQQTILLNVAQAYYSVLTDERSVTVLLNSVSVQNERVRDMEGRQRAGIAISHVTVHESSLSSLDPIVRSGNRILQKSHPLRNRVRHQG